MESGLIKQRQTGEMDYLGKQMGGYQDLENLRSSNDWKLNIQKYNQLLTTLPGIQRANAEAQRAIQEGRDPTPHIKEREDIARKWTMASIQQLFGKDADYSKVADAVALIPEEASRELYGDIATTYRAGMTKETADTEAGLRKRELEEVKIPQVKQRAEVIEQKKIGGGDYGKNVRQKAMAVINYLSKLGTVEEQLLGAGLKPEQITAMISKISGLDTKAQKGKLTSEEEGYIDQAWDTFGIKARGAKDEFGFSIGESKTAADGTTWEYIGNNQWRMVKK